MFKKLLILLLIAGGTLTLIGCGVQVGGRNEEEGDTNISAEDGGDATAVEVSAGNDINADDQSDVGVAEGDVAPAEDDLEDVVFECSDIDFADGPQGNEIKPESDSDGLLAVLFDSDLPPFERVSVFIVGVSEGEGGREILRFSGFEPGDERPVYRGSMPGEAYDGRIEILVPSGGDVEERKTCLVNLEGGLGVVIE